MGAHCEFKCEGCWYTATVSGQPDVGMGSTTRTIACHRCEILSDISTGQAPWDGNPPLDPSTSCPECGASGDTIEEWRYPGPCPKCGEAMAQGDVIERWD